MRPKKVSTAAMIAIVLAATYTLISQVSAAEDKLVLQITTKLGAQVLVKVDKSSVSSNLPNGRYSVLDDLANHIGIRYRSTHECKIVLEQRNGFFVLIPWQIFRSAVSSDSLHIVTVKDGTQYSGKLLTKVESIGDAGLKKTYDLAFSQSIDLVSIAPLSQERMKDTEKIDQTWILSINNSTVERFEILAPHFIFPYVQEHSSHTSVKETDAFYLNVNEEDIPANLSDFESVEFRGKNVMTVIGVGGKKISGTLKLFELFDSKRYPPREGLWMLVSETKNGCLLILEKPIGKIEKVAQSKQEVTQQNTSQSQQKTESTKPDTSKAIPIKSKLIEKLLMGVAFDKDDRITNPLSWPIKFSDGTTQFSFQLAVANDAEGVSISIDGLEDQGGYQATNHNKYGVVMGRPKQWQYGATLNRADGKPFTSKVYKLKITINGETETIPFEIGISETVRKAPVKKPK